MIPFTYLIINFLTIIICFIFSFDRRIRFDRFFKEFIIASVIVAIPFIIWDAWFTAKGIWWFNTKYTMGVSIFNLPLEECLFFICIPFSCVFTYYCLTKFFNLTWVNGFNNIIVFLTIIVCAVIALQYTDRTYTFVTAVLTVGTVFYMHFVDKQDWIGEASLVYTILMAGFLPVNGVLTGTGLESPIVNYNPAEFMNIRIGTIPIEDAVYGYTMILWNLYVFKKLTRKREVNARYE